MAEFPNDPLASLAAARQGSKEALGTLLESYRNYLLLIAEQELDPALRARGGASDLVQQTFLEAQRDFALQFKGNSERELLAWLRRLLYNNLLNFVRKCHIQKNDVRREVSQPPWDQLAGDLAAPCEQLMSDEEAARVMAAVARLPEEYREVLLLRYREGCSLEEIGTRLNCTANAAQKTWGRAIDRLKRDLGAAS